MAATSFVLIPGAGGAAWYWHRVVPLLEAAGHEAIAVDLPAGDERAGLATYADLVVAAIGARDETVLVAQSMGGFTAPLVCTRVRVGILVFVNAMIPVPGETPGAWWESTGSMKARTAAARRRGYNARFDPATYFLHDLPPEVLAHADEHQGEQSEAVFSEPCRFDAWPEIPIRVIAGRDDRFFPIGFQRRLARERLHVDVEALPGGHLVALSNPRGVVDRLLAYLR
jgi:pimeloyl-ACP methyl ester carboxylesterase